MNQHSHPHQESIDAYLRGELDESMEEAFEVALLESPELQDELEAAIATRRVIQSAGPSYQSDSEKSGRDNRAAFIPKFAAKTDSPAGNTRFYQYAAAACFAWAAIATTLLSVPKEPSAWTNIETVSLKTIRSSEPSYTESLFLTNDTEILIFHLELPQSLGNMTDGDVTLAPQDNDSFQTIRIPITLNTQNPVTVAIRTDKLKAKQYRILVSTHSADGTTPLLIRDIKIIRE